ncbi:valine--tRNA ligase [Guggenheimella bovis]
MQELEKTYDPKQFEERIYNMWLDHKSFHAEVNPDKTPYCIVLPPPNITGKLHEGHALNHTMQDILIRYKRMQGFETLWLPGTDHASIATEVKILEKIRKEEGKTKADLTREEFLERAWAWKEEYGGAIIEQMKKLGDSCDWDRLRFTMDDGLSHAVTEVFVRLYEEGIIYRGNRLINWCPSCGTGLSDSEIDHEDVEGAFYYVYYPIEGSDERVLIATTRPETMLGDTAIAVHPEDERYSHLKGKFAILPLVGRRIPIVFDDYVDRELGTGALKVTPAHDPNDYEIGVRHHLDAINIFTNDGHINENGGVYEGLDRFEARKKIVSDLKESGALDHIKEHTHAVGHCYRCHKIVEPMISDQWFVRMKELAQSAIESVEKGEMEFVPKRFEKIYYHWLEGIRDWNISRQLWWGHRIPAYHCPDCGEITVSREEVKTCPKCGSQKVFQDPDVLDTWFSSALWPFSTLGWPEKTKELEYFYPTNTLVTGYDIIPAWVVRMMHSGLKFMGKAPFSHTVINGIVRDAQGRKVSKSLNNGTDPLLVIDEFGADALRFMLVSGTGVGNDTRFMMERVETARNFANKLWNAARFVLMNAKDKEYTLPEKLELSDRWILTELNKAIEDITGYLERFELGLASERSVDFAWRTYCDWYIELTKKRLYSEDEEKKEQAVSVLLVVLEDILKLIHPFMPFITEEIYQHLPERKTDLIVSSWPKTRSVDTTDVDKMELIMEAIRRIRNIRAEMNIIPSKKGRVFVRGEKELTDLFLRESDAFKALASVSEMVYEEGEIKNSSSILLDGIELVLALDDLIDYEKEAERLKKELEKLKGEVKRSEGKLSNQGFVAKAPKELIENEEKKLESNRALLEETQKKLDELLSRLQ